MLYGRNIKQHITPNCTRYIPRNPEKYVGKSQFVICRSSWEEAFCSWCDSSSSIIKWASEEVVIKYQCPLEPIKFGKPHFRSYYPDFVIVTDKEETFLIEVKPAKETHPPVRKSTKSSKTMLNEEKTWRTNQAKWRAAENFCNRKGWKFKIITEKELFGK